MPNSVPYDDLDPGIRQVVRLLNANGFDTVDSGDGRTKFTDDGEPLPGWESDPDQGFDCVIPHPHVFMQVGVEKLGSECDRLRDLLVSHGVSLDAVGPDGDDGVSIQGTYDPMLSEHPAYIMLMGLDDSRLAA
jgi:hypothetical protein